MNIWIWIALILIIIIILSLHKLFKINKFRRTLFKLPGPKIHNFLAGNMPILVGRKNEIGYHAAYTESLIGLTTLYRDEGIFLIWLSINPCVVLFSAETIEPIVSNSAMLDKGHTYDLLEGWLGKGLLISTGNKWKIRRKMITPTFHYRILDEFIPIFDKNAKFFIKNLEEYLKKDWVDIVPLIGLCTLDIISETAMGVDIKSQSKNRIDYINALKDFSDIFMVRYTKPWLYNDFIFQQTFHGKRLKKIYPVLHDLTSKVLKQRKEELKAEYESNKELSDNFENRKKEPLLDTLIKYQFRNSNFTDKDICEEVDTFMFEGHDTTSMGISWTLYHLGRHQNIQQKVYEELQSIFGDDKDRPITIEDTREMKYLECVLKETQRLTPSVPSIERTCTEETKIKGYTIPQGCSCFLFIYGLHHDPKVFPNPEIFDPDRFLSENCIGRHPYAFIPFSAGSRNCIGQKYALLEMKVIVSKVIMNFEIESIDPIDKMIFDFTIVLKSTKGIKLRLKRRQ